MESTQINQVYRAQLSDKQFIQLSKFISGQFGIKMPPAKKIMLQSRLHKRLKALNLTNFDEYIEYVFSKEGTEKEVIHMIDVVSTNKTDFFREPGHFDFLSEEVFPQMIKNSGARKKINAWSAGCSSGEEVYTLAITFEEYKVECSNFDYQIMGSDISSQILNQAINAIYKEQKTDIIPLSVKKKYFLKSKDRSNPTVRVINDLRKKTSYKRVNFMDNYYDVQDKFDIIFCRNVLIYFDRPTQENVIKKLCQHLKPGGYFFLGHSESITGFNLPLQQIKPTIFKRL